MSRTRLRAPLAVLVLAAALTAGAGGGDDAAGAGERPNIVLITTDDQTAASLTHMRRVERGLAARGTSFANMIASFPLCCPARATWITGQYAHNHGVLDNRQRGGGGYASLREPLKVLPVWLERAGYDTALVGKWLHDYHSLRPPPGWGTWKALVPPTVTSYFGYEIADSRGGKIRHGSADREYLTDTLTRRYAVPYIYGQANRDEPFFLHLSYTAPHWGRGRNDDAGKRCANGKPFSYETARAKPAPRHAGRFAGEPLPRPPSFDERDVSDKPTRIRRRERLPGPVKREIAERYRCELASLLAVDQGVKEIDAALAAAGVAERTYVIFTSDNGYMHGEHRVRAEKVQPYEEALRVPFLIRGPGVPRGVVISDPVANADLVPTIMELTGTTQPLLLRREIDGASLVSYLTGVGHRDRVIPIEAKRPPHRTANGGAAAASWVGVRSRRYTYVEHHRAHASGLEAGIRLPIGAGEIVDRELYDLALDPFQLTSRDRSHRYAEARAALAAALARLRSCSGAGCVFEQAVPPPPLAR